jgi:hypothetical protein
LLILDDARNRLDPFASNIDDSDASNITSGPLQFQVPETDFSEWQNVDWVALSNQTFMPGGAGLGVGALGLGGEDVLYDMGVSYVCSLSVLFRMFFLGGSGAITPYC